MRFIDPDPGDLGRAIRSLRRQVGWSQADLAIRARVSQTLVSAVERGVLPGVPLSTIRRLLRTMGARIALDVEAPFLADRQAQRDAGHARCIAFVASRLVRAGWLVATEVEIVGERSRGWIDILAAHPVDRFMLVIEVKTELRDLGAVERTVGWYERMAWRAARDRGWRPREAATALLVLSTDAVEQRARENRDFLARQFAGRARELQEVIDRAAAQRSARRFLAAIDPLSRRASWLRPLQIDGRRSPAPYPDYAGFIRARDARRRARRTTWSRERTPSLVSPG